MISERSVFSKKWAAPLFIRGFPGGTVVQNPSANAGDSKEVGAVPESGRFTGVGNCNSLQYFAWKISRTVEAGGLQSIGSYDWAQTQAHTVHLLLERLWEFFSLA